MRKSVAFVVVFALLFRRGVLRLNHSVKQIYFAEHRGKPTNAHFRPYSYIIEEQKFYPQSSISTSSSENRRDEQWVRPPPVHHHEHHQYDDIDDDDDEEEANFDVDDDEEDDDFEIEANEGLDLNDLLKYVIENIPWEDLLSPSKLTRTEEVRYITEHLVEEGGENEDVAAVGFGRDYEQETEAETVRTRRRQRQERLEAEDVERTHVISRNDCPHFFASRFPAHLVRISTSLSEFMRCRKEEEFGRDPFVDDHHQRWHYGHQDEENAEERMKVQRQPRILIALKHHQHNPYYIPGRRFLLTTQPRPRRPLIRPQRRRRRKKKKRRFFFFF